MEGDTGVSDIERLAVPKRRQYNFENVGLEEHMAGLPPDPLPTWTTLPLDHKLPMIPGPKGAVSLFTTNLGEKIHKRSHELDFDLTDPYAMELSNDYKVLHDPHLKLHLTTPQMKRRLHRGGFITKDGKVLCTLKEFNEYRHYLRKINLLMEKRRERENKKLNASSQIQETRKESEAMRIRELKIKEIKERLSKQFEEDRSRYVQLIREKEERRRKIRQDQLAKMSEKERKIREDDERRQLIVQRRNIEERRRKLQKLRKWMIDEEERFARAQARRQKLEDERQKKLEESWEERKKLQQRRLQQEYDRQKSAEDKKNKRIVEREQDVSEHRKKQQEMYLQIIEKQRREKQLLEQAYADNLTKRLERKRALSAMKRRRKRKGKGRKRLQSNWDIGQTLLNIVSLDDISEKTGQRLEIVKEEKEVKPCINALGVSDHKAGLLSPDVVQISDISVDRLHVPSSASTEKSRDSLTPKTSALDMYHILKSSKIVKDEEMEVLSEDEEEEEMEDVEKAAQAIVDMSMYLTTKVIYPAYMRWLKEDHPEEYERQIDKMTTSTELSEKPEVDRTSEDSDMVLKARGVQFSADAEVVPSSHLQYMQSHYKPEHRPDVSEIGSEVDYEDVSYNRKLSLSYKDSLTRLLSRGSVDTVTSQDAQELEQILRMILEELASGKLKGSQVSELISIARNILDSLQNLEVQEERSTGAVTPEMMSAPSSQFSLLAGEIVQQTLSKVKKDLLLDDEFLDKYQSEAYESGAPVESVSSMAQFIVNKVITSAVYSLQAVSEETTRLGSSGGPRPSSAPATPDRYTKRDLPDLVQEEAPIQVRSETSDLVWLVLQRTAKEVEAEIMKANPTKEVSEMSQFVRHVISQAAQELVANASGNFFNWNKSTTMRPIDSKTSDISYFVQHTISKVLNDMEREGLIPMSENKVEQTASSVFVEHLVELTLQQCLGDVKEQIIPKDDLVSMAAAIIESHQTRSESALERGSPSRTRSLEVLAGSKPKELHGVSSLLVEAFIKETLNKVLVDVKAGHMSAQEIGILAHAFGQREDRDALSDTSVDANKFVQQALENVLKDFSYDEYTSIDIEKAEELLGIPSSKDSAEATELLSKAFAEVLEEMTDYVIPAESKSSEEIELFIKAVLKKTTADICNPNDSRTLTPAPVVPKSKSSEELEAFIYDIINKNALDLALEFGLEYKPSSHMLSKRFLSEENISERNIHKKSSSKGMLDRTPSTKKSGTSSKSSVTKEPQNKLSIELSNFIQGIINENEEQLSKKSLQIPSFTYAQPSSKSSEDLTQTIKEIISHAARDVAESIEIENKHDVLVVTHDTHHDRITPSGSSQTSEMEIVVDADHELHDESSDEALVEPILADKPLSIDHTVIENALSVLSVKKDHDLHHIHEFEAVPRNSFMSLQHPNVAMVKRLNKVDSDKVLCDKILNLSNRCIETLSHPDEECTNSTSSSDSDSLEMDVPLDTEQIMSVQNLHSCVKGPDENPVEEPSKLASSSSQSSSKVQTSSQKVSAPVKQKSSSPYHSRVATPMTPSSSNSKTASSGVVKNVSQTVRKPLSSKQLKTGSTSSMKARSQTSPATSKTGSKPIGQSTPKLPNIATKDSKGTGSFPKIHSRRSYEVARPSENAKIKSESSVKPIKTSSVKLRSKTQQPEVSSKTSSNYRKSKTSNDASARSLNSKSRTSSNRLKTQSGQDTTPKLQTTKSSSKKDKGSQHVQQLSEEKVSKTPGKDEDKSVSLDVSQSTQLETGEANLSSEGKKSKDGDAKIKISDEKINNKQEEKHDGDETKGNAEIEVGVDIHLDNKPKENVTDLTNMTKEETKAESQVTEENPMEKMNEVKEVKSKDKLKTGQTPQSQSIKIKSKFSGNLSINLVEENADALNTRQSSDVSLKSAPPEVNQSESKDSSLVKKQSNEEIVEEIEEDIQTVRRISARKSARSSTTGDQYGYVPTMHSSSDKLLKSSSQGKTVEMISSSVPQLQAKKSSSPKTSQGSLGSSKSNRGSHRTVNLTPRPSSGYSKSPTPQIMNQLSGPLSKTKSDKDEAITTSRTGSSVTSRLMKSISSLSDKIFGRKVPSSTNVEERNIKSPSGQLLTKKKSKGSLIVLSKEDVQKLETNQRKQGSEDEIKPKSHSSKTTITSEASKINSVILSPKESKSSLRELALNANNSSRSMVDASNNYYIHSDNEGEEAPVDESTAHMHNRAGHGHTHHGEYHQHTKDCPSTGSLPELESQSHSIKQARNSVLNIIGQKSKGSLTVMSKDEIGTKPNGLEDEKKPNSISSKTTITSDVSKVNSVILSPKQSRSSLRELSHNDKKSSGEIEQGSLVDASNKYYTHSDNEGEELTNEEPTANVHSRAGHGHTHHGQYHQHTKECPSTGSLPELESQSHSIKQAKNSVLGVLGQSKSSQTSHKQSADD